MKFKDAFDYTLNTLLYGDLSGRDVKYLIDVDPQSKNISKLTSLEGAPNSCDRFYAHNNMLTDLKGAPKKCLSFMCDSNPTLTSLEGAPTDIKEYFSCRDNPQLKNVKEQIMKYRIKASSYETDEGDFKFKDIKEEFEMYPKKHLIQRKGFRTLLGFEK